MKQSRGSDAHLLLIISRETRKPVHILTHTCGVSIVVTTYFSGKFFCRRLIFAPSSGPSRQGRYPHEPEMPRCSTPAGGVFLPAFVFGLETFGHVRFCR